MRIDRIDRAASVFCGLFAAGAVHAGAQTLYVADEGRRAIVAYALDGGLPSATPTGLVRLPYIPTSVAVGPDRLVYVSHLDGREIDVFRPQGHGAMLVRRLQTAGGPRGVALDSSNYLYVAGLAPDTVTIFGPGAHGAAEPAGQVVLPHFGGVTRHLAIDPGGHLFVAEQLDGLEWLLYEYANPRSTPVLVRSIETLGVTAFTADATRELYVGGAFNEKPFISEYNPTMAGGFPDVEADRKLSLSSGTFSPTSIAVVGRHAFIASAGAGTPAGVLTLDIFAGVQTPLAVTSKGLVDPVWLAVSP
jgi:sugar lactone lactonase YvrE